MKKPRKERSRKFMITESITLQMHKIDIGGTIVDDYSTFHDVPVAKCLEFLHGLDACNHANKQLTRSRGGSEGRWEGWRSRERT